LRLRSGNPILFPCLTTCSGLPIFNRFEQVDPLFSTPSVLYRLRLSTPQWSVSRGFSRQNRCARSCLFVYLYSVRPATDSIHAAMDAFESQIRVAVGEHGKERQTIPGVVVAAENRSGGYHIADPGLTRHGIWCVAAHAVKARFGIRRHLGFDPWSPTPRLLI
jgi:hypothetical protein